MLTSERIREPAKRIGGAIRSCRVQWFEERADEAAKLERVARLAKDLDHPDYPEYDWPSGSTEYEARRRRLREALADLPEDALGG